MNTLDPLDSNTITTPPTPDTPAVVPPKPDSSTVTPPNPNTVTPTPSPDTPAVSPNPGTSTVPKPIVTTGDCLNHFNSFIKHEKPGLRTFYKTDADLEEQSKRGAEMVNKLRELGCGPETSKQFSLLNLYDIVMLLDDSGSMADEEGGKRIMTLKKTLTEIAKVYDLACPDGIKSVKFFNTGKGKKDITEQKVAVMLKDQSYWGTTKIGWALERKVLQNFVWKQAMTKPLLVMTITDGAIEGEDPGNLDLVIANCIEKLKEDQERGIDAVVFHFSRVGNDEGAAQLLRDLDKNRGKHVDCLPIDKPLEKLTAPAAKWTILAKLLLGALVSNINNDDEEYDPLSAGAAAPPAEADDDEEDEEVVVSDEEDQEVVTSH